MDYTNKKVIVRCNRAGVFFGTLKEFDKENRIAVIGDCRQLWFWSGAASLLQLATEGVKNPNGCRFTVIVEEISVAEVIEIIPCSDAAIKNIEEVKAWRR